MISDLQDWENLKAFCVANDWEATLDHGEIRLLPVWSPTYVKMSTVLEAEAFLKGFLAGVKRCTQ